MSIRFYKVESSETNPQVYITMTDKGLEMNHLEETDDGN